MKRYGFVLIFVFSLVMFSGTSQALLALDPVSSGNGVTVTGTGSFPNSVVELFINGNSAGCVYADGSGVFSFPGLNIIEGDALYALQQQSWYFNSDGNFEGWQDNAGVTSTVSGGALNVTINTPGFPQIVNTAGQGIQNGHPTDSLKVMEIRLRNNGPAVGVNIGTNLGSGVVYSPFNLASNMTTYETFVIPLAGTHGQYQPANTNWWLLLAFNHPGGLANPGDVISIDYIRIREYIDFHFDTAGDSMRWTPGSGCSAITVAGGSATYSNTIAGTNAWINYDYRDISPSIFTTLETRVNRDTSQANQLEFLNWLDGSGYSDADFGQWGFTDGAGYEILVTDLVANDWGIPSGPVTLNNPAGTYSSHFPPNAGETTSIDYIRIRPATVYGPSAVVVASGAAPTPTNTVPPTPTNTPAPGAPTPTPTPTAPPIGKLILNQPNVGTGQVVTGYGAPANGSVELFINGISQGSVQANASGVFSFGGLNLAPGDQIMATLSQVWNFNTNGNFEGWTIHPAVSEVTGGILRMTADNSGNTTWANGTGNPANDNTPKVIDPSRCRVFEMRYRITTAQNVGTNIAFPADSDGFNVAQLNHQPWNAQKGAWITTIVDFSTLNDGSPSPFYPPAPGKNIIQLVVGVNGLVSGDLVEVDYIRLSEGFQWEFNHDGDLMDWKNEAWSNISSLTVSGGKLNLTASDVNPTLFQPFSWLDTDYYKVWSSKVSASAGNQAQFETLLWVDNGGADNYGANGNSMTRLFTDNGTYQEATVNLTTHTNDDGSGTPSWGPDPTSKALAYRPFINAIAGNTASIDYLRLFPANAFGPSNIVSPGSTTSVENWNLY